MECQHRKEIKNPDAGNLYHCTYISLSSAEIPVHHGQTPLTQKTTTTLKVFSSAPRGICSKDLFRGFKESAELILR